MVLVACSNNCFLWGTCWVIDKKKYLPLCGVQFLGWCSRYFLEAIRNDASISILNITGNQVWFSQNGTTKKPSAFLALFFPRHLEWSETVGRHRVLGSSSQLLMNQCQRLQGIACKNSKYQTDGLHCLQIN